MSHFSDTLNSLINHHEILSNDVCRTLNISKSSFSKIKNGTLFPKDFNIIKQIAYSMNLSVAEEKMLINSYKVTKYGDNYLVTENAIKRLCGIKSINAKPYMHTNITSINNGTLIESTENIFDAVASIISRAKVDIKILFIPQDLELSSTLKKVLLLMPNDIACKWFIYLDNVANQFSRNIDIFVNAIKMASQKNASLHYSYTKLIDLFEYSQFPYMVSSESELLLIDKEFSNAIYFNDSKVISTHQQHFDQLFENGFEILFSTSITGLENIINQLDRFVDTNNSFKGNTCNNFYIIEKRPCIFPAPKAEISSNELMSFINDDTKNYEFAMQYRNIVRKLHNNIKTMKCIFCETGLNEYFEIDDYYEFNNIINTRPISKFDRNQYIKGLIDSYNKNPKLNMHMVTQTFLNDTPIDCINIWGDGRILIMFNFKTEFLVCTLKEKSIADSIILYFETLKDMNILLSNKDTFEIISRYYDKYNN